MDSSGSEEDQDDILAKKLNEAKYSKVLSDGSIDSDNLQPEDYALVKSFIKEAFPSSTKVLNDLDQTLKRTFVLGRSKKQKLENSFNTPKFKKIETKLSMTKLRALGLHKDKKVPHVMNYEDFLEVHNMWNAYVADLLSFDEDPTEIQRKLNKIDLHGAIIQVFQSNCKSFELLEGIVVKETRNTFVIVTCKNITKTIPKAETVFDVKMINPSGIMRIAGNSFLTRPAERVSKKIKSFMEFLGPKVYKSKLKYSILTC